MKLTRAKALSLREFIATLFGFSDPLREPALSGTVRFVFATPAEVAGAEIGNRIALTGQKK